MVAFVITSAGGATAATILWFYVSFSGDPESTKLRSWVNMWLLAWLIGNLTGIFLWRKVPLVVVLLIVFSLPILVHFFTPTF